MNIINKKNIILFLATMLVFAILGAVFLLPWGITTIRRSAWTPIGLGYSDGAVISEDNEFKQILQYGDLTMYANLSTGEFYIQDTKNNKTWYSNPPDRANDTAIGFDMQQVNSRMIIDVNMIMAEGAPPIRTRFADIQSDVDVSYRLLDNAVVFVYEFERAELHVPIKISLLDYGFVVELLNAEVNEFGRHRLIEVMLLPAFGAAGPDNEGYMLVPDGSGALIYLNNGRNTANRLGVNVYGFNAGAMSAATSNMGHITMPLWGKRINDDGYLAIITSGAARSSIMAQSGGMGSIFNMIYASYTFRETGSVTLVTQGFNVENITITETLPDFNNNFRVEYHFLDTGKASYTDMANTYRSWLGLESKIEKTDRPFYLDIYGHIIRTLPWFGFPRDTVIPTATFSQTEELIKYLNSNGINNTVVRYSYWQRNGYYNSIITNPRPLRNLGGASGLRSLKNTIENLGGELYLTHEPIQAYNSGNGFIPMFDGLKTVSRMAQRQFSQTPDRTTDFRYDPWFLVRPQRINHFFDRFFNNFYKLNLGNLALDSIGEKLYSELASDGIHRDDVLQKTIELLDIPQRLMLNGAFDYGAMRANHVINSPIASSGFDIYDEDIPFWQIVFHGYVNFSLEAFNLSSNPSQMRLRALETGANPMFTWVLQNSESLIGSRSDWLFSGDYSRWLDWAIEEYNIINAVLSQVSHEPITAHNRIGNISITEYGGRLTVICNFSDEEVIFMEYIIPAWGFVVI